MVEVTRIAAEIRAALDYAHRQGVIHRDIKPENIFLHEGSALVTDFGIARLVSEAASGARTGPGMAIGTPAYMSPEQAAGEDTVDGRADQYGLACVLHEMLTGKPLFEGTGRVVMARQVTVAPPSVRDHRPDLPPAIAQVVLRALAKNPDDRYPNAAAFAAALSTPLAGLMPDMVERSVGQTNPSLAVLPLRTRAPIRRTST